MDFGWVAKKTQVAFCEARNGAAYFCLPGSPKLAKAVIVDFADGEFRDVSWTADEVRARVQWGEAPAKNDLRSIGKQTSKRRARA